MNREEFERLVRSETGKDVRVVSREEMEQLRAEQQAAAEDPEGGATMGPVMAVAHGDSLEEFRKRLPPGMSAAGTMKLRDLLDMSLGMASAQGLVESVLNTATKHLQEDINAGRNVDAELDQIMIEECRKALKAIEILRERLLKPVMTEVTKMEDRKQRGRIFGRRRAADRRETEGAGDGAGTDET